MKLNKAEAARQLGFCPHIFYNEDSLKKWAPAITEDGKVDMEKARYIKRKVDKRRAAVWDAKDVLDELKETYSIKFLAKVLGCHPNSLWNYRFGYPIAKKILDFYEALNTNQKGEGTSDDVELEVTGPHRELKEMECE